MNHPVSKANNIGSFVVGTYQTTQKIARSMGYFFMIANFATHNTYNSTHVCNYIIVGIEQKCDTTVSFIWIVVGIEQET